MKFPKLYKLTSSKKVQEWEIFTEGNKIIVIQGQLDGKKQRYEETIKEGKSIGRSNETTPEQQADAEAKSKWEHKHNKDYHIATGNSNQIIANLPADFWKKVKIAHKGGYLPMLAQSYEKHAKKHLKYPCYIQPKLDGLRCISTKDENGVKLWFRSGKEITTMGHIVANLDLVMEVGDIFDGELYVHGEDFNSFTGAIRANKNLNPEITEKIQYHVYDCPRIKPYREDIAFDKRFSLFDCALCKKVVKVDTRKIYSFEQAMELYKQFIEKGYEGIMFRNTDMPYEQKRSYNLLKYKKFIDDEFIIVSAKEEEDIFATYYLTFACKIEPNRVLKDIGDKDFKFGKIEGKVKAKMMGTREYLKRLFKNPKEYMGKPLTIKYQNLSKDGIPRFPVGKTIRFDK